MFLFNLKCFFFPIIRRPASHLFVRVGGHQKNASLLVIWTWNKRIPMWDTQVGAKDERFDQPACGLQDNERSVHHTVYPGKNLAPFLFMEVEPASTELNHINI